MLRREFLAAMPIATTAAAASANGTALLAALPDQTGVAAVKHEPADNDLRFRADGSFKILSISDTHYVAAPDIYGISMTERLIQTERPDVVIVNGDTVTGKYIANVDEMKAAVGNVATAIEKMGVPWAVTLGNHDGEGQNTNHVTRTQIMSFYESYPHNRNAGWVRGIKGVGNKNILVWDDAGIKPLFNIWLLDSLHGHPDPIADFGWIQVDQIDWYNRTSIELEKVYERKINSLMFFHIPLPEFQDMIMKDYFVGAKGEPVDCPAFNSGLFAAALTRQDVKGIFCGHDHENNLFGKHHGIDLGYDGVAGFITAYPHFNSNDPKDPANGQARGGRVFVLNAADPGRYETWMRFNDGSRSWESSYFK